MSQHFFASSFESWTVDETLDGVIDKQSRRSPGNTFHVYRVPLPLEAEYRIERFKPQVEGLEFVKTINA